MATVYSSVSNHWRAYLTYSTTETDDAVTITAKGGFGSYNYGFDISGVDCTLSCTGQTSKSASGSVYTAYGATTNVQLASTSWTISKGSSAKSVTVSSKVVNDSGFMNATLTASTTISIPAKSSFKITFNANGGTGAPSSVSFTEGSSVTIPTATPYKSGYTFIGWSTSSSATSPDFYAGETITGLASNISLYAVYQIEYGAPTIKSLSAERCNSSGSFAAMGYYARVSFDWTAEAGVSSIRIAYGSSYSTVSVTSGQTSNSVSKVVGGSFSTSSSYTITVTVTDLNGKTASASCPLGTGVYAWSVLSGGSGLAVGKNADTSGFDCGFNNAYFYNVDVSGDLDVDGDMSVGGSFSPSSVSTGDLSADGVIHLADDGTSSDGVNVGGSYAATRITGSNVSLNAPDGYFYLKTSDGNVWINSKKGQFCQSGYVDVTPSAANTPTGKSITFPYAFKSAPKVALGLRSTVPGASYVSGVAVSNESTTGCTIYVTRNNTTSTRVHWIAAGAL